MLNVRVKKALLTILTACLTVLMTIGAILGFAPTPLTVKAESAWTLVKNVSDLKVDDQVIIVASGSAYALGTNQKTSNREAVAVTKSDDKQTVTFTSSVQVLTLKEGTSSGTFGFYTGSGYLYAASSSSNHLKTQTTNNANGSWKIEIDSSGVATIKATGSNSKNWLRKNSTSALFACYSSGQDDVSIYKKVTICDHQQAETVFTSNGKGSHSYKTTCSCGYTKEGEESCESYYKTETDGVTTTFTCTACEYSYFTTEETYTVSFCVPDGVDAVVSMPVVNGNTIVELPTADAPAGYTFEGWVTKQAISATRPELFDITTKITEDIKLYALYKYEKASNTVITSADQLKVGMKVAIADKDSKIALGSTQGKNNRSAVAFDAKNISSDVQLVTLENGFASGYALNAGVGYLYTDAPGDNRLFTTTTLTKNNNCDWTITINNGAAVIKSVNNTARGALQYNNSNKLFACYDSETKYGALTLWEIGEPVVAYTTLSFDSASLTLGEGLVMNYKVAMDDEIAEDAEMTFEFAGETYENVEGRKEGHVWVYSLQVAPQYMGENITAELKLGDTVLASKATYSVKEYAESLIKDEKSTNEVKQLASDLLHYGAAAQAYYAEKEEQVAGEPVNNVEGILANKYVPSADDKYELNTETLDEYPVYFKGANLNFSSLNTLYVTLNKFDEKVQLFVDDDPVTLTGKTYSTGALQATDFDKKFTFKLYYDGKLMQTLTYSVNAYAYEFGQAGKEGTMADLARALYNYGKSVEAYVAAKNKQA